MPPGPVQAVVEGNAMMESLPSFERRCLDQIMVMQGARFPDEDAIATLAQAVRCAREYDTYRNMHQRKFTEWLTEREVLRAQRDALLDALKAIHDLLDGEIAERFRTSASKNEAEMGRRSVIYSLLSVPRNMAKAALQSIEAPSHD